MILVFSLCMLIVMELLLVTVTRASHKNLIDTPLLLNGTLSLSWYDNDNQVRCSRCCKMDKLPSEMKCIDDEGVQIEFGYCVTFDGESFESSICHYFQSEGYTITEDGYVILPDNVSELNDYMCHTMNRQGTLCSECIDGFSPAVSSAGFICSNCTNVWYGVPLYLLMELLLITVLYLVILTFQINLTSAPWTAFILFSHILLYEVQYDRRPPVGRLLYRLRGTKMTILEAVYGIMNLEIIRFAVPPFCVSSKLQSIHVSILQYLPALYPLCLILLTWLGIELHGHNFRPLVWAWKPFHECFFRLRRGWSYKSDLIDVFASFFLLSFGKIMFQSLFIIGCQQKTVFNNGSLSSVLTVFYDPSIPCKGSSIVGVSVFVIFLVFVLNLVPVLLLCLYPIKAFRACLSKSKLEGLTITTFINKFHGCYRDGLDGGRDMRSLSGLYFFLRALSVAVRFVFHILSPNLWLSYVLFYLLATLLIAWLKPYRKMYMNLFDTVVLAIITLMCLLLSSDYFDAQAIEIYILSFIPVGLLMLYIIAKAVTNKNIKLRQKLLMMLTMIQASGRNCYKKRIKSCDRHATMTEDSLEESVPSTTVSL